MWVMRLRTIGLVVVILAFLGIAAGATAASAASPLAGPCAPGASYDPACDVDHDGDVDIFDIQLSAGHWNQTGTWMSDNDHNHLGQTWTGTGNPLKITGSFSNSPDRAPLVLGNSSPFGNGLRVEAAGADGVGLYSVGNDGVYVGSAGGDGIEVFSAGDNGLLVTSAGENGVHVTSAGSDGVYVQQADDDGIYVERAGNPSFTVTNLLLKNGVEVDGAEGYGVFVGRADWAGVFVSSAGRNGVDATSASASYYGGWLVNSAIGGGGVYAKGGGNDAADIVLGGSGVNDDGRIYSEPLLTGSDILLFSNDRVHVHLDEDNNTAGSNFIIFGGDDVGLWSVSETGMAVAAGPSAVQVDAGQQGKRLTYAVTSPQNWVEDFGSSQLKDGEAVIALDTAYAEALSAEQPYYVFLTPLGDCALYVAEKGAASFTVRALGGETCSIAVDYRIVGLRRGYETVRMEQFVEPADE